MSTEQKSVSAPSPKKTFQAVSGYVGIYSVDSQTGGIFSHPRSLKGGGGSVRNKKGKYLKPVIRSRYFYVTLCGLNGLRCNASVHRLVCETVNGHPPTQGMQVNHKDGDKSNNRPDNLEWVTRSGNMSHAYDIDLKPSGERSHLAKLSASDVIEIRSLKGKISQSKIGARFGVTQTCIQKILSGKKWKQLK